MVLDTSAVLAILLAEPDAAGFEVAVAGADRCLLSAVGLVEASIVLEARTGPEAAADLDAFVVEGGVEVVPVTIEQAQVARHAYRRFGRGRHPARLNLGDCFAYALAVTTGEPLLFKGADFALTDVARA